MSDELIAKCSPRGWGNPVWTGYYAYGDRMVAGVHIKHDVKKPARTYVMEHATSTKRAYRTIDEIKVTNGICGVGHGWDIVVCDEVVDHRDTKTAAQCVAETLLDGMR